MAATTRMRRTIATALAILACGTSTYGGAQTYPAKAVRFVVGFAPGGGSDVIGRIVGQKLAESTGQQFFLDNRPGAAGNIAVELVTRAPADGYTIMLGHVSAIAISPSLYPNLAYDSVRDLAPVAQLAAGPHVLVVHPALPVKTVKGLVDLAKAKPGQLLFASSGSGSVQHLSAESFKLAAGIDMVHVPYKGSGPAALDLMAGQVQLNFDAVPPIAGYLRQGRLRAIAVTTLQRSVLMPELPTIAESGYPGFDFVTWWGLFAPAKTPKDVVERLNAETVKALRLHDVSEKLHIAGAEPVVTTPETFAKFIKNEIEKWGKVVRAANVKVE